MTYSTSVVKTGTAWGAFEGNSYATVSDNATQRLDGHPDDLRLYNGALTQAEVGALAAGLACIVMTIRKRTRRSA